MGIVGVTGGVDTHADMHVAAAIDVNGGLLGVESFGADSPGYEELLGWLVITGRVVNRVSNPSHRIAVADDTFSGGDKGGPIHFLASFTASPNNDDFVDAEVLVVPSEFDASSRGATRELLEPDHCTGSGGDHSSVWWKWTAPEDGLLTVDLSGSGFDTILAIYTGTSINALTLVACDDSSGTSSSSLLTDVLVTGGETYRIAVADDTFSGGDKGGPIHFLASFTASPNNDDFVDAEVLVVPSEFDASSRGATRELLEPDHCTGSGGDHSSVWWKWTAPEDGLLTVDLSGSGFDTILAIYTAWFSPRGRTSG